MTTLHIPPGSDSDRELLFGVVALQADVISKSQFIDACWAWAARKNASLADLLTSHGWLDDADREIIERLVQRKLKKHEGDVRSSLVDAAGYEMQQTLAAAGVPVTQKSLVFSPSQHPVPSESPDQARGRYRLTRPHAAGGIGQVWLAHDGEIGRDVALKELRPERGCRPGLVERFVEEARITGKLEHPGIVPVYELAHRADGQPFYTMRFISGRTLNEAVAAYHERRKRAEAGPLELRELLGAFVAVCNTIAYANSRGVIHRDLKGSNVVLGEFGEVIVVDWGIAKLTHEPATPPDASQPSDVDAGLHPSPIIADGPSHDLSVQGQVIGTPAYMAPEQAQGRIDAIDSRTDVYGLGAMLYEVLTGRPPFSAGDAKATLQHVIHEPPVSPRQHVPGTPPALDAVCLKALAKRPEDRYPTATALARDIQHFLGDAPVSAYPDPWATRLARWARRHRSIVAAGAALLVATVGALTVGMVLLSAANARTQEQRNQAEVNLTQARQAERQTSAITHFLTDDLLGQAAPERNARDKRVTVEEVLGRASAMIADRYANDPEVEAAIRYTIGDTYYKLGVYGAAEVHLRRAVDLRQNLLGSDHPDTIGTMTILAENLWAEGKAAEAEALGRSTLDAARRTLGPEHRLTMMAINNLAVSLYPQGRLAEAEPLFHETLELRRRVMGPEHAWTIQAVSNLARVFMEQGKLDEAEAMLQEATATAKGTNGPNDPVTLTVTLNLGSVLTELGKVREAEPILRDMVEACGRVQGAEHQRTLSARDNLNRLFVRQEKYVQAEEPCRQNLEACRRQLGATHQKTLAAADTLGLVLLGLAKLKEAENLVRETLQLRRRVLRADHYEIANSLEMLGLVLDKTGRYAEAEPLLREGVKLRRDAFPAVDRRVATIESALGSVLTHLKHYEQAESLLLASHDALARAPGAAPRDAREADASLVALYEAWGKPTRAAQWRARQSEPAKP
jgi:serine/threonine protein kinase/tetratricopeptide (TPR) repeat protein